MRHVLSGGLAAAALGAVLLVSAACSASAQIARPQPALAGGDHDLLTLVRGGGGGGGGSGSGGGGGADRSSDRGGRGDADGGDRIVTPANSGSRQGTNQAAMPRTSRDSAQILRRDRDDRRHQRRLVVRRGVFFDIGDGGSDDYAYASVYDQAVAYCMSRFHTYDLNTRTYIGKGGKPKPCP